MKRQTIFLAALLLSWDAPINVMVSASDAPVHIRFAYASRSNIVTPKHVAQSKGFFKAEGLEVEMIQMNPRLSATAIINGDVTYADAFTSTFRGMMQGFPIKLVFVHQKKGPYFLIARPEIKDIQQLKEARENLELDMAEIREHE